MILNRSGEPSGGEANASGRNGFEALSPSFQRISTERSQPTCLVVEDDHTMRHLLMNYLGEHDIRAISASRRDEVAGLLVREEPSLVILDLRLCQEDGLDLLREITLRCSRDHHHGSSSRRDRPGCRRRRLHHQAFRPERASSAHPGGAASAGSRPGGRPARSGKRPLPIWRLAA
jgi:CheY-like chemotaxis protein